MDEDVVGIGLHWACIQLARGGMAYERVKAVAFMRKQGLANDEEFAYWARHMSFTPEEKQFAHRLWEDGKVIQPKLFSPEWQPFGVRVWVPWSEFTGGHGG